MPTASTILMSRTALRVLDQFQDLQGGFGLVVRQEAEIVATEPEVLMDGGLSSARLNAGNRLPGPWPWPLSFSYARALQAARLGTWGGDPARVGDAKPAFYHRARCNGAARPGMYTAKLERSVA